MFLAQYGIYESGVGGSEAYAPDITRQFYFSTNGEYDHMAQLHCTLLFEPTPQNRAFGEDNMWQNGPSDEFFDRALAMPGFAVTTTPLRLDIDYSPV